MASTEPPVTCILQLFSRPGERVFIMIEDWSYELVCDPVTRRWHFESEYRIDDQDDDRRPYDPTMVYPEAVLERLRRAAAFARAYFDIEVDERVGVATFARAGPVDRWQ